MTAAREVDRRLLTVLARTRAARGGTLQVTGLALPQFLTALDQAELDEVFVVYDALQARPAESAAPPPRPHPLVEPPSPADLHPPP